MYLDFFSIRRSERVWLLVLAASLAFFFSSAIRLWMSSTNSLTRREFMPEPAPVVKPERTSAPTVQLPPFDPSILVNAINRSSRTAGIAVGAIDLTLDRSADAAFVRYRAKFQVSGTYVAIKEFLFSQNSAEPVYWLDHVHCLRDTADAKMVRCDIALSAFYDRLPDDAQ